MTAPTIPGLDGPPVPPSPGHTSPRGAGDDAAAARDEGPAAAAAPRVVGVDLSLQATGISDGTRVQLVKSKGTKTATLDQRRARLESICDQVVIACAGADLVVIEGPSFGQARQGGQHDRAGLWWLVVSALGERVVEVPPATLKTYATGKGNAGKDEVLAAVVRRYPAVDVGDNNTADALVLAAMGLRHHGWPIDDMPLTHLRAMAKVAWPSLANEGPGF